MKRQDCELQSKLRHDGGTYSAHRHAEHAKREGRGLSQTKQQQQQQQETRVGLAIPLSRISYPSIPLLLSTMISNHYYCECVCPTCRTCEVRADLLTHHTHSSSTEQLPPHTTTTTHHRDSFILFLLPCTPPLIVHCSYTSRVRRSKNNGGYRWNMGLLKTMKVCATIYR